MCHVEATRSQQLPEAGPDRGRVVAERRVHTIHPDAAEVIPRQAPPTVLLRHRERLDAKQCRPTFLSTTLRGARPKARAPGPDSRYGSRRPNRKALGSHLAQEGTPPVSIVPVELTGLVRKVNMDYLRKCQLPGEASRCALVPSLNVERCVDDPFMNRFLVGNAGRDHIKDSQRVPGSRLAEQRSHPGWERD